ncbi:hypothetical protein THIX_60771 [Thiomonas sp. X19]|nr:hypothetical protein THIX_30828 [Thiomonas sp. X19]SCC94713.1 hypothetical protein THIX_60771 [Thiomonas sp. X19]
MVCVAEVESTKRLPERTRRSDSACRIFIKSQDAHRSNSCPVSTPRRIWGGRRWFRIQDDKLKPLVADNGISASAYRFRLLPLVRLAAQCGVGDMRNAYDAIVPKDSGDEEADDE